MRRRGSVFKAPRWCAGYLGISESEGQDRDPVLDREIHGGLVAVPQEGGAPTGAAAEGGSEIETPRGPLAARVEPKDRLWGHPRAAEGQRGWRGVRWGGAWGSQDRGRAAGC